MKKRILYLLLPFICLTLLPLLGTGCEYTYRIEGDTTEFSTQTTQAFEKNSESTVKKESTQFPDKNGIYTTKEDVMNYLITYGTLPDNFITKEEARQLGWSGGSLEPYAPSKCIGGDYFGNYEGLLPTKAKNTYRECDIDTLGKSQRGAKRIIYSEDGQIYYTQDHYESFTLLYEGDGKE